MCDVGKCTKHSGSESYNCAVPSVRANEVVAVSVIAAIIYWPQLMRRWVLELNMYIYLWDVIFFKEVKVFIKEEIHTFEIEDNK